MHPNKHLYFNRLKSFIISPLVLSIITLLNFGCATMLEGSKQEIKIHCEPSNNVIIVADGEESILTDGLVILDKKRDTHFVTLKKEGYHPSTLAFNREVNPFWPVADLIWLPAAPIAWLIDWMTASIYQLDPKDVNVVLREKGGIQ